MKVKITTQTIKKDKDKTTIIFNYGLVILEAIVKGDDIKIYFYQDLKHNERFRIGEAEEKKLQVIVKDILEGKTIRSRKEEEVSIEKSLWSFGMLSTFVYINHGVFRLVSFIEDVNVNKDNPEVSSLILSNRVYGDKNMEMIIVLNPADSQDKEYLSGIEEINRIVITHIRENYKHIYGNKKKD